MNIGARKKVMLKVIHEDRSKKKNPMWTHFCYVNSDVYSAFFDTFGLTADEFPSYLTKWTREDFNLELDFTMNNHIRILKELVIDKYKQLYPHMYYNDVVDNHGWMRVWLSEKMGKEIRRYDREKYKELFGHA
nr:MAG TPA: hypothetical protein [Caudoviricetes sp.]